MSSITTSTDLNKIDEEEFQRFTEILVKDIVATINGKLDFQSNFSCKLVSVPFPVADAEVVITHGLGRIPAGYIQTGASVGTRVYDGVTPSTTTTLYLRANTPATVGFLIY